MNANRFLLAALVLGSLAGVNQANAQCSGNAGGCLTINTASATVNALVKLGMSAPTTTISSPTADQVDIGATIADPGPTFTVGRSGPTYRRQSRTTETAGRFCFRFYPT